MTNCIRITPNGDWNIETDTVSHKLQREVTLRIDFILQLALVVQHILKQQPSLNTVVVYYNTDPTVAADLKTQLQSLNIGVSVRSIRVKNCTFAGENRCQQTFPSTPQQHTEEDKWWRTATETTEMCSTAWSLTNAISYWRSWSQQL